MKINYKKILSFLAGVLYCLLILVAILLVATFLPIKNNIKIYSVMSGSMEPTLNTGSLIVVLPQKDYQVRDVITFQTDEQITSKRTTTHRIVAEEINNGNKYFTTKGDANNTDDSNKISEHRVIGKLILSVPLLGYLIGYIKTLPGLLLLIIIPSVIIIYEELKKIHRESKNAIASYRKSKSNAGKSRSKNKTKKILLDKEENGK